MFHGGQFGGKYGLMRLGPVFLRIVNKLACFTEQTHDIRLYGLCDGARFAVPWRQAFYRKLWKNEIL